MLLGTCFQNTGGRCVGNPVAWWPGCLTAWHLGTWGWRNDDFVFTSSGRQGWVVVVCGMLVCKYIRVCMKVFAESRPPRGPAGRPIATGLECGQSIVGALFFSSFFLFNGPRACFCGQEQIGIFPDAAENQIGGPPTRHYGPLALGQSERRRGLFRRCAATCLFLERPSPDEDRPAPGTRPRALAPSEGSKLRRYPIELLA